jgi:hypothetical protein
LSIHQAGAESQKFLLVSVDEVKQVIKDVFGIPIPRVQGLEERLKLVLGKDGKKN